MKRLVIVPWLLVAIVCAAPAEGQQPARVTIIYDAFGKPSDLQRDWGFAALVEYGGKSILFDTGNNAQIRSCTPSPVNFIS